MVSGGRAWVLQWCRAWLSALLLSTLLSAHPAQPGPAADKPPAADARPEAAGSSEAAVTHHVMRLRGDPIAYTATAGYIPLTDEAGKLQAKIFYVAYTLDDGAASSPRPLTFAFNGGPGASSMWLHLGVGPRRVVLPADGTALPDSTVLVDNEATWLPFTDLVFVDPVGTGYSRAAEGVDEHQFYEVVRDVQVAAAFVRRYLTQSQRWLSPKFIVGESYGTTRAAALANWLQNSAGMNLNGVVLVSSVLDFQTIDFDRPNDLAYVLALPSYAATAWFHGKRSGQLGELVRDTEQWATSDYLVALTRGAALGEGERTRIVQRLERDTGIDEQELRRRNLRIDPGAFGAKVLREPGRTVGRFDSRVTAPEIGGGADHGESDPSFFLVTGPLVEGLNHYLRSELGFRSDLRYEYLSREANRSWKWRQGGQGYLYVADDLAQAMQRDPRLHVFAAAGYYDLATPYAAQKHVLEHMELDPALRGNLTFVGYPSGHQIYTDPASALKLQADVQRFVRCTLVRACD